MNDNEVLELITKYESGEKYKFILGSRWDTLKTHLFDYCLNIREKTHIHCGKYMRVVLRYSRVSTGSPWYNTGLKYLVCPECGYYCSLWAGLILSQHEPKIEE